MWPYSLRRLALISLFLASSLLLFSCDNGAKKEGQTDASGTAETELSLKIGAMPSMDILPFLVAQKTGVYDSLGLQLEIVKFYSANDRDAALQSHNVEGTVIDYTGAMMQEAAGIPVRLVMKLDGYFLLMARPGLEAASASDLKGTRIGVSSNTVIEYATDLMLREAGLSSKDISKVEVNKIPLRMEMLRGGKMDATVLPDPFITITQAEGMKALASTQEMGISVTGLLLTQETLTEKADAVALLLQGYDLGVDYIRSHSISALKEILTSELGFPEALAEKTVLPAFTHREKPSREDIEGTHRWLLEKGLVPEVYSPDSLVADL